MRHRLLLCLVLAPWVWSCGGSHSVTGKPVTPGVGLAATAWPKPYHDAQKTGRGIGSGARGAISWHANLGYAVQSPVIGLDGSILTGFTAFNPSTGAVKWDVSVPGVSVVGAPVVGANGDEYFFGSDNQLRALDASTGQTLWTHGGQGVFSGTLGQQGTDSPTIGADGTVYYCASNSTTSGTLYAVDGTSGTQKWSSPLMGPPQDALALGQDGTVYVSVTNMSQLGGAVNSYLEAFDGAAGGLKWASAAQPSLAGTPTVDADGTISMFANSGFLTDFDASSGAALWQTTLGALAFGNSPLGKDGTFYMICIDQTGVTVVAFDPTTQTANWTATVLPLGQLTNYWPQVLSLGSDGTIYVPSVTSILALNGANGSQRWSCPVPSGQATEEIAIGANGTLYFVTANPNVLYAIH